MRIEEDRQYLEYELALESILKIGRVQVLRRLCLSSNFVIKHLSIHSGSISYFNLIGAHTINIVFLGVLVVWVGQRWWIKFLEKFKSSLKQF